MQNINYYRDAIEKYLKGQMLPDEKAAFEKIMLNDDFLKDAVEGYKQSKAFPEDLEILKMPAGNRTRSRAMIVSLLFSGIAAAVIAIFILIYNIANKDIPLKSNYLEKQIANCTEKTHYIIPVIDTIAPWIEAETIYTGEMIKFPEIKTPAENIEPLFVNKILHVDKTSHEPDMADLYRFRSNHPYTYICGLKVVDYRFEKRENRKNRDIPTNRQVKEIIIANEPESENTEYTYTAFLEQSLLYYKQGKFTEAIENFNLINNNYPGDLNALFYKGMCYYEMNKNQLSLESFAVVIEAEINTFSEESKWYSSLILREEKQYTAAEKVLEEIVKENGYYGVQARKELDDLYDEFLEE